MDVEGRLPAHWRDGSFELVLRSKEATFDSRYRLRLGEPPEGPPAFQAMPGDTDRLSQ
ncbi:MAG: hypothetical protein ACLFTU_11390 [Puniceicoccaceae bacterium]